MNTPTEDQLGAAFRDLVAGQPFAPDEGAIKQRARRARKHDRIVRGGVGLGVVAVAAVTAVGVASGAHQAGTGTPASAADGSHPARTNATSGAHPAPASAQAQGPDAQETLVTLAAHLAAAPRPAGDATLMERVTASDGYPTIKVWDLYADNNQYFFSQTKTGLPSQVKADNNQGDGQFGQEKAAAASAVNGNLASAELKMAWPFKSPMPAALKKEVKYLSAPTKGNSAQLYNRIWIDCEDALVAGSGDPQVRAGVLRLVSSLPGVTVSHGTADGQPTLAIAAGAAEFEDSTIPQPVVVPTTNKHPLLTSFRDTITINADTGVPLQDVTNVVSNTGAPLQDSPSQGITKTVVTYTVTRVSLSDIAAGKL